MSTVPPMIDATASNAARLLRARALIPAWFSPGQRAEAWGGEVTRYLGRHGTRRVSKAVLISAIPPLMLKTPANPGGLPIEVFDGIRAGVAGDRSEFYRELSAPFYGANRPGSKVSKGVQEAFWFCAVHPAAAFPTGAEC